VPAQGPSVHRRHIVKDHRPVTVRHAVDSFAWLALIALIVLLGLVG